MSPLDYVLAGIASVFLGPEAFSIFGIPISMSLLMVFLGFLAGITVGATPGMGGGFLMAISLPILISIFGFTPDALMPVMGFLIGVMKGATIGGAVPAILFNTPGTPDALMTTLDGYPMAKNGQAGKALKTAHFASASGDTFSDLVLFTTAPFLAILVEDYLGFAEKAALIILSMSFVAAVVGDSPMKGMMSAMLGLFLASIGKGEDFYPRLSMDSEILQNGFPLISAILGILIVGEVFYSFEEMWREHRAKVQKPQLPEHDDNALSWSERRSLMPFIGISAVIGTIIGALPGIGSTLAATLGYAAGHRLHTSEPRFGDGAYQGVAATEAANSAVSGANLIPVLSLGIPGTVGAVFLILAAESIGGFDPGPAVFRFSEEVVNPQLVIAFGLFTAMMCANIMNWVIGGQFMRVVSVMARVPKHALMPIVLLLTLTAMYVQQTEIHAIYFVLGFGFLGYIMKKIQMPILPFVISFVLAKNLEQSLRQAFSVADGDPYFLVRSPLSVTFLIASLFVVIFFSRKSDTTSSKDLIRGD